MTLVYSTETGRIKPSEQSELLELNRNSVVKVQRQTKGRKGKGVCIINGLGLEPTALKILAAELKKVCACGGSIKGQEIEIQGDKKAEIRKFLEKKGYKVVFSGG